MEPINYGAIWALFRIKLESEMLKMRETGLSDKTSIIERKRLIIAILEHKQHLEIMNYLEKTGKLPE